MLAVTYNKKALIRLHLILGIKNMALNWLDVRDIAIELEEAYPDVDNINVTIRRYRKR